MPLPHQGTALPTADADAIAAAHPIQSTGVAGWTQHEFKLDRRVHIDNIVAEEQFQEQVMLWPHILFLLMDGICNVQCPINGVMC